MSRDLRAAHRTVGEPIASGYDSGDGHACRNRAGQARLNVDLRETTRSIIAEVKAKTGCNVVVQPDASLTTLSAISMARGGLSAHVIRIHPSVAEAVDYHVIHHCGLILRLFETPPEQRVDVSPSEDGVRSTERAIKATPLAKALPASELRKLRDELLAGLIRHLRSVPIGMRVDRWIAQDHLQLAASQRKSITRQLRDNAQSLSGSIRQIIPVEIVQPTLAVSAALALFWSRRWNEPQLFLPYRAGGLEAVGQKLLQIWEDLPDSGGQDQMLIDTWADALQIRSWYRWVPYVGPA
jgi:hypothetical protein